MENKKLKAIRDGLIIGLIGELVFVLAFGLIYGLVPARLVGGLTLGLLCGVLGYFDSLSDMKWCEFLDKCKKEKK